jgi:hypothetical protein
MLREITHIRQIKGEQKRRWFSDDFFDLVVWVNERDDISGFQLSYDRSQNQRALTWHTESGFTHDRIDDGEGKPGKMKATPILIPDSHFNYIEIGRRFKKHGSHMDERISTFVYEKIMQYRFVINGSES